MKLHNTLTQKKQEFTTIVPGKVGMYVCGPTVYDRPHIGNARSVVVYDTLYRILCYKYGSSNVTYVRNITDVDDKINIRATELNITIQELTSKTYKEFKDDMSYLNCLSPTYEPKATEHIKDIIAINNKLIENGNAYVSEGHVYFNINSAMDYGVLSGRNLDEMIAGARIEVSENKRHPGDFVLWKPSGKNDDKSSIFESPWGPGRPGWHIECSAMSHHFLGADFDIHGGGVDLIFPHHTNEIAQSCCAFPGSKFARFWVHNGFLTVNGEKMSKSLNNFITIHDLAKNAVRGEVIRYLFLSTHHRKPLDWSDKALYDAKESLDYLYRVVDGYLPLKINETHHEEFISHLEDDINTPAALHFLHNLAKQINKTDDKKDLINQLISCANLIGLLKCDNWFSNVSGSLDISHIENLISKRIEAKKIRDFGAADKIRDELASIGIELEDKSDGTSVWRQKY